MDKNNKPLDDIREAYRLGNEEELVRLGWNPRVKPTAENFKFARDRQIRWFEEKIKRGGYTVVPTKIYFSHGKVKVEIALAKGKKEYDKRETIKNRDLAREMKGGHYDDDFNWVKSERDKPEQPGWTQDYRIPY